MKNKCRLSFLSLSLIAISAVAGYPTRSHASLSPVRTDGAEPRGAAQAQSDCDLMRKALEEAHSGLYRYATKSDMDRVFDSQRANLNRAMSKREFLAVLAEVVAQIKCGHTGVRQDEELQKQQSAAKKFPL